MSVTFNELLDAGVCTGGCLLAPPRTRCDCRCNGYFHAYLCTWLSQQGEGYGYVRFPGFQDIDVIRKGKRLRAIDHSEPSVVLWGRTA